MEGFDFLALPEKYSSVDIVSYQYFHQLLEKRTIVFNSEISEDIIETFYLPLREFEQDDSDEPITVILNSVGGSVSDGFFLANYLASYKKKINLIVAGYAASMAAVILSAGGKNENIVRKAYPSTYVLIHDGYVALSASEAKTANDIMAFNNKVDEDIRNFIISNTNITEELYDSKARKQWFISAQEAVELNLIDEIME
jgi:ATP-dependent Clp protease protease subunit